MAQSAFYTGPGPRIIGKEAYEAAVANWHATSGGRVGPRITGPMIEPVAEPVIETPVAEIVEGPVTIAGMHVQTALAAIRAQENYLVLEEWLTLEEARENGARPTVVNLLRERLGR